MHDAHETLHDNGRSGEFTLAYLTREEVAYIARRLRWQLDRVDADIACFHTARVESESHDEAEVFAHALRDLNAERQTLLLALAEFRRAWRRPTVAEVS